MGKSEEKNGKVLTSVTKDNKTKGSKMPKSAPKDNDLKKDLANLTKKFETIQEVSLPQMRDNILHAVLNIFEQISFIEEADDIKSFINSKINSLACSLGQIPTDKNQYSYTLEDVESDIAKLRLTLDGIKENYPNNEITEICKSIEQIGFSVENLQNIITNEQLAEFKSNLETLNEECLSISSRTNQILLNSDELHENLQHIQDISDKTAKVLEAVTDNVKSEKSTHQALAYLGEWIDSTGSELNKIDDINKNLDMLVTKCPDKFKLVELIADRFAEQQERFTELEKEISQQQERFDRLEKKLDQISSVISEMDDTKIIQKVDKIEQQLNQLNSNVEKLTSYVD